MQYAQKRLISGLFCIFMVSIIIFNSYEKRVYADAGSIVIAGGSLAAGGLGAGALAGLGGPVVIAVILAGMAFGVNVELTQASQEAGMTKTQFVQNKINQYCNEAQISASTFNSYVLEQMKILNDGRIKLGDQACRQIKQFYNWLFDSDQVQSQISAGTGDGTIAMGNLNCPVINPGSSINVGDSNNLYYNTGTQSVGIVRKYQYGNTYVVYLFNTDGGTLDAGISSSNGQFSTPAMSRVNGYYFYNMAGWTLNTWNDAIPIMPSDIYAFLRSGSGVWNPEMDTPVTEDTFTGDKDTYDNNSGVLNPSSGQTTVLNPGLVGTLPIPADKDLTIDVQAYLDALQKILDKLNDITIPAVDDATGIPIDIDIDDTDVIDPTIEKEDDTDMPSEDDQTPVINDNPIDPSQDPVLAAEPLKFDLRNIFPFCIPFDIKDMLAKLSAEPVAPTYNLNWHIPIVNTDLVFTVDLSSFNSVASILRNMELITFIIGLAFITRSLIRG